MKFKFAPFFFLLSYLGLFFIKTPSLPEAIIFVGLVLLFGTQILLEHFSRPTIEDQIRAHKDDLLKQLVIKDENYRKELDTAKQEFSDQLSKISMNLLKTSQLGPKGDSHGNTKKPVW